MTGEVKGFGRRPLARTRRDVRRGRRSKAPQGGNRVLERIPSTVPSPALSSKSQLTKRAPRSCVSSSSIVGFFHGQSVRLLSDAARADQRADVKVNAIRVNLRPDEDGAREFVQRLGRQMFPASAECSRRVPQPLCIGATCYTNLICRSLNFSLLAYSSPPSVNLASPTRHPAGRRARSSPGRRCRRMSAGDGRTIGLRIRDQQSRRRERKLQRFKSARSA